MEIQGIGVATLAIGLLMLMGTPSFSVTAFFVSTLFAASGAILLPALGAMTIQPAHFLLPFFAAAALFGDRASAAHVLPSMKFPKVGFWLLGSVAYAIFSATFLPRLFAGATEVVTVGVGEQGPVLSTVPLGPTSGNVTQLVYLVGDVVCFLSVRAFLQRRNSSAAVIQAVLIFAGLNVVFAIVDLATFWTNTASLLSFMRNSTYVMHDAEMMGGLKRIVGSFTEASAFAAASLGAIGVCARLWLGGVWPRTSLLLTIANCVFLLLSTSSTAYVSLPVLLMLIFSGSLFRALRGTSSSADFLLLIFVPLGATLAVILVSMNSDLWSNLQAFLSLLIFDKGTSESGMDRAGWNEAALQAFWATYGLGAGAGSVRASSFFLAVLANLGVVGAVFYFGFLALVLVPRKLSNGSEQLVLQAAAKTGCVGLLISSAVSGALIDLGLPFFFFAGVAVGPYSASAKRQAVMVNHGLTSAKAA